MLTSNNALPGTVLTFNWYISVVTFVLALKSPMKPSWSPDFRKSNKPKISY